MSALRTVRTARRNRTARPFSLALSATLAVASATSTPARAAPADGALGACGAPATRVHAIQGSGSRSPLEGRERVVEAVVVGLFPGPSEGLGGFFVQEEARDTDADPRTSEGLFVYESALAAGLEGGELVRVRGRVGEFFGRTELSEVSALRVCPRRGRARPVHVRLPVASPRAWERWEGMRVRIAQRLVATGHRELARFGELELAAGARLGQPTHRVRPGAPARALRAWNERRRLLLDDGSDAFEPEPTPYLAREGGGTLRLGDAVHGLEGVLDFAFGRYRIHPTEAVRFEPRNPRPSRPPRVRGTLRVATWNLDNHFNGDGRGGGFGSRGPSSPAELARQRAKLVTTLERLDPDVAALVELENDGVGPESALGELVRALNRRTEGAPYALVDPGEPRLGEHAIAVGILYRPSAAAPIGPPAILDARAQPSFDDARNRPSLAQTFEARATGERFTLVANHWKSKGSDCDAAGDPDRGDGQGDCNGTRRRAARALLEWLEEDPTGAGGAPVLVAGDLNAYPREDPLRALESAGFVDLVERLAGPEAHTFVFDGAAGRLDHLLGDATLLRLAGGAGVWHTNADEPRLLDFRRTEPPERFAPGPFRASDHDPVLLGLFPDADGDGVTDARDACPRSLLAHAHLAPTVRLGVCGRGARKRVDARGCTFAGRLRALREGALQRGRWRRAAIPWLGARLGAGAIVRFGGGAPLACAAQWGNEAGPGPSGLGRALGKPRFAPR